MIDFRLPELGENVTAGDVLRILVKPGDTLARDQPVLELETDKATIEVPSTVSGLIREVKVNVGDNVKVGQAILIVDDGVSPQAAPPRSVGEPIRDRTATANTTVDVPENGGLEQPVPGQPQVAGDRAAGTKKVVEITRGARPPLEQTSPQLPAAPAAPSVRRMARELGVDINHVPGSGTGGRISIDDVKVQAKRLLGAAAAGGTAVPAEPLPDFSRWGEVDRQAMRAVRRKTADHLSAAWASIPHVTQHDLADITTLEDLRKRYAKEVEAAGGNLTYTAIAVKLAAAALKVFPRFNASIDLAAGEIIYKKYVNIGIAVDTDRGLLVPVIRAADTKNVVQIAVELSELSEKARTRKISLDEMQGGCFSISNLGGIGGSFFTPIVNSPEVAILGISRARIEPAYNQEAGAFQPRLMLPLSLSYDHRVIDGADGARFLRWIVEAFEQPFVLALRG